MGHAGNLAPERDRQEVHSRTTFQNTQASCQEPVSKKEKQRKTTGKTWNLGAGVAVQLNQRWVKPSENISQPFITTVGKGIVILYQLDTVRIIWKEGTSNREAYTPSQPSLRSQSPWSLHTLKLFRPHSSHTRCSYSCDTGQLPTRRYQASPLNGRNNRIKNSICIALKSIPENNKEEGKTKEEQMGDSLTTHSTVTRLMTAFNTAHSSSRYGSWPSLSPFPTLHETTKQSQSWQNTDWACQHVRLASCPFTCDKMCSPTTAGHSEPPQRLRKGGWVLFEVVFRVGGVQWRWEVWDRNVLPAPKSGSSQGRWTNCNKDESEETGCVCSKEVLGTVTSFSIANTLLC